MEQSNLGKQLKDQISEAFGKDFLGLTIDMGSNVFGREDAADLSSSFNEILDKIVTVAGDEFADIFADPDLQGELKKICPGAYNSKQALFNAYERLYVRELTKLVNTEARVKTLAEKFNLNISDFNSPLSDIWEKRSKKAIKDIAGESGFVGNFFEDFILNLGTGGGNDPRGDLNKISLELKTQYKGQSGLKAGDLTITLPDSINRELSKEQERILAKVAILFKMIIKMRNFLLVRYRFDDPTSLIKKEKSYSEKSQAANPNRPKTYTTVSTRKYKAAIGMRPKQLFFEEIVLFMVLKIAELWDEIEIAMQSQEANRKNEEDVLSITSLFKGENQGKIIAKEGNAYKIKFSIHMSTSPRKALMEASKFPKAGLKSHQLYYVQRGFALDKIYRHRIDLLQRSRTESIDFRARLFGFIKYNKEWLDASGFAEWNKNN